MWTVAAAILTTIAAAPTAITAAPITSVLTVAPRAAAAEVVMQKS